VMTGQSFSLTTLSHLDVLPSWQQRPRKSGSVTRLRTRAALLERFVDG
jgi:hypothetical protein